MSNKTQLQQNNIDLQSILSAVDGLPTADSVKHGLYVWKKSTKKATVTFVQTSHNPITLTASSSDIDLSTVDASWFVGIKCNYNWATATYAFEFMENDVFVIWTADGASHLYDGTYSYNQATKTITTNINPPGSFGINSSATKQEGFIEFVVADNANAYPNGGTQGGYWYEKVIEGTSGIDFGEITITDNYATDFTVAHKLGKIPTHFVFIRSNWSVDQRGLLAGVDEGDSGLFYDYLYRDYSYISVTLTKTTNSVKLEAAKYMDTGSYYWFAIA